MEIKQDMYISNEDLLSLDPILEPMLLRVIKLRLSFWIEVGEEEDDRPPL
jgi:hypothetical protein